MGGICSSVLQYQLRHSLPSHTTSLVYHGQPDTRTHHRLDPSPARPEVPHQDYNLPSHYRSEGPPPMSGKAVQKVLMAFLRWWWMGDSLWTMTTHMVGSCSERAGMQGRWDGIVGFLALGVNDFVTETMLHVISFVWFLFTTTT